MIIIDCFPPEGKPFRLEAKHRADMFRLFCPVYRAWPSLRVTLMVYSPHVRSAYVSGAIDILCWLITGSREYEYNHSKVYRRTIRRNLYGWQAKEKIDET